MQNVIIIIIFLKDGGTRIGRLGRWSSSSSGGGGERGIRSYINRNDPFDRTRCSTDWTDTFTRIVIRVLIVPGTSTAAVTKEFIPFLYGHSMFQPSIQTGPTIQMTTMCHYRLHDRFGTNTTTKSGIQ